MTGPSAVDHRRTVLTESLAFAVPFAMAEFRSSGRSTAWLVGEAKRMATFLATHGDDLQFGGKHCGPAFNALARGLACLALVADGGAAFAGLHWCRVPRCPGPDAEHLPSPARTVDVAQSVLVVQVVEGLL
jgi:hypothetical protein